MDEIQTHITELIGRIIEAVHPLRIILFGSAARGEMTPDSDIDVLVVMPEGSHRLHTAQDIYQKLFGIGISVDIVVATPQDLDNYKDNIGLIYKNILEEGRELYAA